MPKTRPEESSAAQNENRVLDSSPGRAKTIKFNQIDHLLNGTREDSRECVRF